MIDKNVNEQQKHWNSCSAAQHESCNDFCYECVSSKTHADSWRLLCGDIHKRQIFKLTNGGNAVMIGSMIQQNFGETVNYHGYGIYDFETKKYETFDIENEQPFLHFSISDISDIEKNGEILLNIR